MNKCLSYVCVYLVFIIVATGCAPSTHESKASSETYSSDAIRWMSAIAAHLNRYWKRPSNMTDTDNCVAVINITKTGTIIDFKVLGCDGKFKLSVEQALLAASPLPKAPTPDIFEREIQVTFTKPRR